MAWCLYGPAVHASYVGGFATAVFDFQSGSTTLPLDEIAMGDGRPPLYHYPGHPQAVLESLT